MAARARARVVAWAAEGRDGDVDALLLEAAEQVAALGAHPGRRRLINRKRGSGGYRTGRIQGVAESRSWDWALCRGMRGARGEQHARQLKRMP